MRGLPRAPPLPSRQGRQPEPPALEPERMDVVDNSAHRAVAPAEQQPGPSAEGGLRTDATEFSPGLPMAEVVAAWNAVCEKAATVGGTTTIHALSLEMYRRSEAELFPPLASRPGYRAAAHYASTSSDAGSSDYGYSGMLSD